MFCSGINAQDSVPKPTPEVVSTPYKNVVYFHTYNVAPCAVKKTVEVLDPCFVADPCDKCTKPRMVSVEICVPNNVCDPVVTVSTDGRRRLLTFGEYRVRIVSVAGKVRVLYGD